MYNAILSKESTKVFSRRADKSYIRQTTKELKHEY